MSSNTLWACWPVLQSQPSLEDPGCAELSLPPLWQAGCSLHKYRAYNDNGNTFRVGQQPPRRCQPAQLFHASIPSWHHPVLSHAGLRDVECMSSAPGWNIH
ncbi:hypothetical protein CEXT_636201 [Caerostris extrusa]|uniref:Uncharacterized protein n=1 Tax=Caerostris extrusa TaxID=172846 RepID=A0AAV4TND4_CAEEX|nr:hypothetical protein CEXT_636201 [Caerostris extrusa]